MSIYADLPGHDPAGAPGLARALRARIVRGEWQAGEQMPPIGRLATRFGTTAVTVRRALRLLEDEGLVRVRHGVGTFVGPWSGGFDALSLPSFAEAVPAAVVETAVCERRLEERDPEAARALGQAEGTPVALLVRLRSAGGTPVAAQRSFVCREWSAVVEAYRPERSLYDLLRERTGRLPASAEERLSVVPLPEGPARLLRCPAGSAGWRSCRTTFSAEGEPLVYDEAYFPALRVEISLSRRGRTAVVRYLVVPPPGKGSRDEPEG